MNIVQQFEQEQVRILASLKTVPKFDSGDTVRVSVKINDGATERIQKYEGVVISKVNRGISSSFTVRKISDGIGIERCFKTYSPLLISIEVIRYGVVRRAKLYYLRNLRGKAARIKERRIAK